MTSIWFRFIKTGEIKRWKPSSVQMLSIRQMIWVKRSTRSTNYFPQTNLMKITELIGAHRTNPILIGNQPFWSDAVNRKLSARTYKSKIEKKKIEIHPWAKWKSIAILHRIDGKVCTKSMSKSPQILSESQLSMKSMCKIYSAKIMECIDQYTAIVMRINQSRWAVNPI